MIKLDVALLLAPLFKKLPRVSRALGKIAQATNPETVILLDYPVKQRQRWTIEKPHKYIHDILSQKRETYRDILNTFADLNTLFAKIPRNNPSDELFRGPYWENGWIPALDGIAIYGFVASQKPKLYLEIGSGNSTKFARKAIEDFQLDTKIISVDPQPRAEIDTLCDQIIRKPLEDVRLSLFDTLGRNDIFFVDSSHRTFMNSDVTTVFLDIIPRLKPGVLIQIHDITLPYDYPCDWIQRWYSEQYLMASLLLARGNTFDILLPNSFVSHDEELQSILMKLFDNIKSKNNNNYGYSFWLRKN